MTGGDLYAPSRPVSARFGAKNVASGSGNASDHGVSGRDSEVLAVVRLHSMGSKDKWWSVKSDGSCWNMRLEDATHDAFAFKVMRGASCRVPLKLAHTTPA